MARDRDIQVNVLCAGKRYELRTYAHEYRSLMALIYDKVYLEDFGDCKGIGRCGTCHVLLLDYRGFGKSTGKRSEKEMLNDMQFIYNKLKEEYAEDHLIVYGRSMGSGFATKLACDNNPRYLILDAPYFNFLRVIERFLPILPVRVVLRFHLRTDLWLPKVTCHTYIIHGTKDWLIPIRHSEALQKINPKKITLIRIHGGGHNNLPTFDEYHNFVRDILKY